MDFILGIIIGFTVGIVGMYLVMRGKKFSTSSNNKTDGASIDTSVIDVDLAKKHENIEKIREFVVAKDKITNNDIQVLLGVSDATATRYLDELEKEGLIKQVGESGYQVYYHKL